MKVVHYKSDAPWVGSMKCTSCEVCAPAWQSSGMSESFPHFYCDTCSNVLHRERDKERVYPVEPSQQLLDEIAATLPGCPCGGQFKPGTNPKCPNCRAEYKHHWDPVRRLVEPHMIILDGACLIRDRLYSYRVCIGSKPKYWLSILRSALTSRSTGRPSAAGELQR